MVGVARGVWAQPFRAVRLPVGAGLGSVGTAPMGLWGLWWLVVWLREALPLWGSEGLLVVWLWLREALPL